MRALHDLPLVPANAGTRYFGQGLDSRFRANERSVPQHWCRSLQPTPYFVNRVFSVTWGPRLSEPFISEPKSSVSRHAHITSDSENGTPQTSLTIFSCAVAHSIFCFARSRSLRAASISLSATAQCERLMIAPGFPTVEAEWKNCVR